MATSETVASKTLVGHFFWYDLLSRDPAVSEGFFTRLCGWQLHDVPVADFTCHEVRVGGKGMGSIMPHRSQPGAPSVLVGSMGVPDVAAALQQAQALGASVVEPLVTMPGVGSMAVIADPQGAWVKLFAYEDGLRPLPVYEGQGAVCWQELVSPDVTASRAFYEALCGWTGKAQDMGGTAYHLMFQGDDGVAGMMAQPPGVSGPATWVFYLYVDHLEDAVAKVPTLGGTVRMGIQAIPDGGRYAVVADPTGCVVGLYSR